MEKDGGFTCESSYAKLKEISEVRWTGSIFTVMFPVDTTIRAEIRSSATIDD